MLPDELIGHPVDALFIGLQPDSLQMGREPAFFPVRDLGQDVAHEVDLAALPGGAQPFLSDRGRDSGVGVGEAERRPLHAPGFELPEEEPPRVLRLVEHRLHSQDLPNDDGAVREWLTPVLEDNYNHRHSSQLYALFDGMPDELARDLRLQAAFKRLIEIKLERHWTDNKRGFMSFGLVQLGQTAASLGVRDLAYRSLEPLVKRYWYHNLASTHDDNALFNMDISGGLPAVIRPSRRLALGDD